MGKAHTIERARFAGAASGAEGEGRASPSMRVAMARHEAALIRYATRIVGDPERARDIVQDTFVRLLSAGDPELEARLPQWLYTVCRNRALDVVRKQGRRERLAHHIDPGPATLAPDALLERRELLARARAAVERLPEKQALVLRLKLGGAQSYAEIAEATGLSTSHIGYLLHHALRAVRDELAEAEPAREEAAHGR